MKRILLTTIHLPLGIENETCTKNISALSKIKEFIAPILYFYTGQRDKVISLQQPQTEIHRYNFNVGGIS